MITNKTALNVDVIGGQGSQTKIQEKEPEKAKTKLQKVKIQKESHPYL